MSYLAPFFLLFKQPHVIKGGKYHHKHPALLFHVQKRVQVHCV